MKIKTDFPKFWPILWLCTIALVVMGAALSPSNLDPTQFTNSGPVNGQPFMSLKDGAVGTNVTINNITNVNLFSSNIFATNITVNEFKGRTEFVTNLNATFITNQTLITTNAFITYLTNITAYVTNLFAVTEYVTNLNVTYLTNQTFYTTNVFATTVNATTNFVTQNFSTNLFSTNIITTNLFATFITNNTFFTTNVFATTVNATTNFNTFNFSTNLFSTNVITTNLFATFITNNTLITTNLFVSNVFATNITVDVLTNNLFVSSNIFTTNLFVSNIFTTNITLMEAIWNTNKWNGPTNDVSFKATYQKFVASTDMEMTGLIDSSASNANTSVVLIDPNGATRTLYFPAVFTNYTSDGNNAYTIPKTNIALVTLFQYGNQNTNVVVRLFGPGTGTPPAVAQVWTNDTVYIYPTGQTTNGTFVLRTNDGSIFSGTAQSNFLAAAANNTYYPLVAMDSTNGAVTSWESDFGLEIDHDNNVLSRIQGLGSWNEAQGHSYAQLEVSAYGEVDNSLIQLVVHNRPGSGQNSAGIVFTGPWTNNWDILSSVAGSHIILHNNSLGDLLSINNSGDLDKIKNVSYSWPSANASGALTNDGSGNLGWGQLSASQLPNDIAYVDKNNAWTSASSNYVNSATGYATNSNNTTPDFAFTGAESLLSTNNNFTWLAPIHVDQSGKVYQFIVIDVTNSSGSSKVMTLPANVHQCNSGVGLTVTNFSKTFWEYWPPSGPTNFYHVPGY